MNREELARSIVAYAASGELPMPQVTAALHSLFPDGAPRPERRDLIEALLEARESSLEALSIPLRENRRKQAVRFANLRHRSEPVPANLRENLEDLPLDAPLGWTAMNEWFGRVVKALPLLEDRLRLSGRKEEVPSLTSTIENKCAEIAAWAEDLARDMGAAPLLEVLSELEKRTGPLEALRKRIQERLGVPSPEPGPGADDLPGAPVARYAAATTRQERQRELDRICTWPTDRAAEVLSKLDLEPWAQERTEMILTLRFGVMREVGWDSWRHWLLAQSSARRAPAKSLRALGLRRPAAILYLWHAGQSDPDPEVGRVLEKEFLAETGPFRFEDFCERWGWALTSEEARALSGGDDRPVPAVSPVDVAIPPVASPPPPASVKATDRRPAPPPLPPRPTPVRQVEAPVRPALPSVWETHLKPFILANWYMIAGVVMVVVGSSLLAYYTWDKHWLIRYSLMPSLLGAFTAGLAWMGGWIERKDAQFRGTAAVLRSAAIGLLPVNFMAVALLANDSHIVSSQKLLAVPLLGALYVAFFGWNLRRWSSAVHSPLGWPLAGSLLFLNLQVTLAPVAKAMGAGPGHLHAVAAAGFYLAFLTVYGIVRWFSRTILTPDLAKEKRVSWFFGATLAVTFLQVFAWVHGYLEEMPRGYLYAPMVMLAGGLILGLERRTLELRGQGDRHGAESFLGFACILLGILLGIGHPVMRILAFGLAGGVWILQTVHRRQALHHWIGLGFLALGCASIGLLEGLPPVYLPSLGIGSALLMGLVATLSRREPTLVKAARGMQASLLMATLPLAILSHWHFGTPSQATALAVVAVAALLAWRGWRDAKIAWVQTSMVVLAMTLPYLSATVRPGLIVAGLAVLSFLWIGVTAVLRSTLLEGARSTVLWIYGGLALATVALRGTLGTTPEPEWLEWGGLAGMIAALIVTAWYSRSLIPSGMAMVLGAVLASAVRGRLQSIYPHLEWGAGLDSGALAVAFALAAFWIRARLGKLSPGDRYMGRTPYPLVRLDHTLFAWPLLASSLLLAVKVETWNFLAHLCGTGMTVRVSMALGLSGVAWTLQAIYHRDRRGAVVGTYLGLLWLILGAVFGLTQGAPERSWSQTALVVVLSLQGLFFGYRLGLERLLPWVRDLLTRPTERYLRLLSLGLSALFLGVLGFGGGPASLGWLLPVVLAQLTWQALASKNPLYGVAFGLTAWSSLLAWTTPGEGLLFVRVYEARAIAASLWMILVIQAAQAALEAKRSLYDTLRPLVLPLQVLAILLVVAMAGVGIPDAIQGGVTSPGTLVLLLLAVLLSARAIRSGPLALLGAAVAYLLVHSGVPGNRTSALLDPWHASLLAVVLAAAVHTGRVLHRRAPKLLLGAFAPPALTGPVAPWLWVPATAIACGMALVHTASPELRDRAVEVQTPYWGALTLGILAASLGRLSLFYGSGALLSLGNIHLVRTLLGDLLRTGGISELHLICLGLGLTLLQATLVRRLVRQDEIARMAARSSLVWAALILALLSANYLVHPNLESIGGFRFGVSGALSLLAGWYFRWAARHPAPSEERAAIWCEGFYHFGTTMALWCAALLVPALRHPVTALVALGLPVLYFYGRAEWGRSERYLHSAATLGFLVLSLYVLRPVFQMILFPEAPFETDYYHRNSPCIFVLGMILLRLRALGGTSWLAFYGGLAVMGSVYFALTALPGMSPFHHPVESAWCAIALAHFFTLASAQRSPLRTAIQRLAGIDVPEWQALRRPWGVCLLVASQGMALYGLLEYGTRPLMVAPLLVGAASVWIHQGILRGSTPYAVVGRVLFVLALHAGLVVPSYLPATHILWALLGLWAAMLAIDVAVPVPGMAGHAATLFVLAMAQVLFQHHPYSTPGLWGAALAAGLAALTPRPSRSPGSPLETLAAASLPWAPAWLVGWSQASIDGAWPVLAASGAVLLTGVAAGILGRFMTRDPWAAGRLRARLFDQSLSFLRSRGRVVYTAALGVSFLATLIVLAVHPRGGSFGMRELGLSEGLCVAFLAGWIVEGLSRRTMAPFFLAQASALAGFLALRTELLVPLHGWRPEYDLWVSLGVFLVFSALRERLDPGRRHVLVPVQVGLLGLPAFSLAWSLLHPVGAEFALLLVGLHSAAFAFLGRDDRESPYHLVAIGGAVTFACVLFWSKLHLREVYAYVEPVGLGVLVLVQLFARKVAPEVRTGVRATALVGMLGSVGYYCLLDRGIPVANHLVLIVLCLGMMGLGGLLRIRLYLALGFGALMADLLALFVKMVAHMERSVKMTLVGSMVLAMGAALVFGAIWVKTHQKELAAGLERWRLRFSGWE